MENSEDKLDTPTSNRQMFLQSPSPKSEKMSIRSKISSAPENIPNVIVEEVNVLADAMKNFAEGIVDPKQVPITADNVERISRISKMLTNEANYLSDSIKQLSEGLCDTKDGESVKEDISNFPYHLFLMEIIINKIHMKCECFEPDYNNLVISCTFLNKQPIILYDSSSGKITDFSKLNVGKSTLFAMTYDRICSIKEFEIILDLLKQPPCSHCVTKIAETHMDYTDEFHNLRDELCKKWTEQKPNDNIMCTSSTPLKKNQFYLTCGEPDNPEAIGVIEVSIRMSFLGKEITTAYSTSPKPEGTSVLLKEENGISMYSCQKVEMDDGGKILLDEEIFNQPTMNDMSGFNNPYTYMKDREAINNSYVPQDYQQPRMPNTNNRDGMSKYDEIYTQMNSNELKIKVPKSTKVERMGKYDKINELCSCDSNPYNAGDQIQFELPRELCYKDNTHDTYTSNLKYTYKGCNKTCESAKDKRIINVTPTNCPAPVTMEKMFYPGKDVFILKIGKKLETKDKKTDLEIELVTPQAPMDRTVELNNAGQQCASAASLKSKSSKGSKKKKGSKKGKKGKDGKAKQKKKGKPKK